MFYNNGLLKKLSFCLIFSLILFFPKKISAREHKTFAKISPSPIKITITGVNISQETFINLILEEIKRQSILSLNEELLIDDTKNTFLPSPPPVQQWKKFSLPLIIKKDQQIIEETKREILVFNEEIPQKEDDFLAVSNNPEKISSVGKLLSLFLNNGESARLMYHHKNETKDDIYLGLIAKNPSENFINVHFVSTYGGSNRDEVFVGHQATKAFLKKIHHYIGQIHSLPPQQTKILSLHKIKPQEVVASFMKIHLLYGENVDFQLVAFGKDSAEFALMTESEKENINGRNSAVFKEAARDLYYTIETNNKAEETFTIGSKPYIVDSSKSAELVGNFGLLYRFHITLTNSSQNIFKSNLYISSRNGVARSLFQINKKIFETGLLQPENGMQKVLHLKIPPKTMMKFKIITFPQPGSNYPVAFTFYNEKEENLLSERRITNDGLEVPIK